MTTEIVEGQMVIFEPGTARLNITWSGQNGDLADPIPENLEDAAVKSLAAEAIRSGAVPGISSATTPDFSDFIVERYSPTPEVNYSRLVLRPKTPFGA